MAGKGRSSVEDQMPEKDDFFSQLDTEGENLVTPPIQTNESHTMRVDQSLTQEADRIEQLSRQESQPPETEQVEDKSDMSEVKEMIKTQAENINAFIMAQKTPAGQEESKEQPRNLAEYLFGKEGAEEFVYDPEEAVSDPDSDSARYHRAEIALEARRQIDRAETEKQQKNAQIAFEEEKKALMDEFNMSEKDFQAFEREAEERRVSLKDIYLMIHREQIADNIAKNTVRQYSGQRTRMSNMSPAMSGKGGHEVQKQTDSQFFSTVFGVKDSDLETTI